MASFTRLRARLSEQRNLFVVVSAWFFAGLETSIINVVWQPFILSLGASMSLVGLVSSLNGYNGLIPSLVSPLGGWFADRRGRKRVLLVASLSAISAYALYTIAGFSGIALAVAPGILLAGAAQVARPVNNALVGESVRAERHGSAYSLVMFANIAPGILAPLAAGWLASLAGYAIIFPVALGAELISFTLILRYLHERAGAQAQVIDWNGLRQLLRRAWVPPRGLVGFFSIVALDALSWGMGWGLLYGLLTKQYGFSAAELGILSSVMSIAWAGLQLPAGRLVDRVRIKTVLVLSEATGPPLMLIWMTQARFEIIAASMVLFALNAALWVPARSTFITRSVAPEFRAEAFGRLVAFGGLFAFPGPFIGGFLFDHFGFMAPLFANLVGSFVTTLVIILFVHEPQGALHLQTTLFSSEEDSYAKS